MSDSFTNAGLWAQKAYAQAASGQPVPPPPDGPLTNAAAASVVPLPDGVSWADPELGTVCFAGAANPKKAFFWFPARNSAQKGSLAYAEIAYNCITAQSTWEHGWLIQVGKRVLPQAVNAMTGLPSFIPDTSSNQNLTGVYVIPASIDTLEGALAWSDVRNP